MTKIKRKNFLFFLTAILRKTDEGFLIRGLEGCLRMAGVAYGNVFPSQEEIIDMLLIHQDGLVTDGNDSRAFDSDREFIHYCVCFLRGFNVEHPIDYYKIMTPLMCQVIRGKLSGFKKNYSDEFINYAFRRVKAKINTPIRFLSLMTAVKNWLEKSNVSAQDSNRKKRFYNNDCRFEDYVFKMEAVSAMNAKKGRDPVVFENEEANQIFKEIENTLIQKSERLGLRADDKTNPLGLVYPDEKDFKLFRELGKKASEDYKEHKQNNFTDLILQKKWNRENAPRGRLDIPKILKRNER